MAVWKKSIVKMGIKKVAGLDVTSPIKAVNIVDKMRRFHRGSWHLFEASIMADVWLKVNDMGKSESKPTLDMPFLSVAPYLLFSPIKERTPQPPFPLLITPA